MLNLCFMRPPQRATKIIAILLHKTDFSSDRIEITGNYITILSQVWKLGLLLNIVTLHNIKMFMLIYCKSVGDVA